MKKQHLSLLVLFLLLGLVAAVVYGLTRPTVSASDPPSFIHGEYAYVPIGNQIQTIEISDPLNPKRVGRYIAGENIIFYLQAVDNWVVATFYDGYDPMTGEDRSTVVVLDARRPHDLRLATTILVPSGIRAMLWHDQQLFISSWGETSVYNMANPAQPTLVTRWAEAFDAFAVADDQILYASRANCNLRSALCQSALREIERQTIPKLGALYEYEDIPFFKMTVNGAYLHVVGRGVAAVPRAQLAHADNFAVDEDWSGWSSLVQQTADKLYLTWGNMLRVSDTTNPAHPQKLYEIAAASSDTYFTHMAIQGNYLYLVSWHSLHVYSLAGEEVYGVALFNLVD